MLKYRYGTNNTSVPDPDSSDPDSNGTDSLNMFGSGSYECSSGSFNQKQKKLRKTLISTLCDVWRLVYPHLKYYVQKWAGQRQTKHCIKDRSMWKAVLWIRIRCFWASICKDKDPSINKQKKTLISTVLWLLFEFLTLRTDVHVQSKSTVISKKTLKKKHKFCWHLFSQWRKIRIRIRIVSQWWFAFPDP